jgi:nucleotide-binding universal stress UspA family protein
VSLSTRSCGVGCSLLSARELNFQERSKGHVSKRGGHGGTAVATRDPRKVPTTTGYAEQKARKLLERQVEEIRAAGGTVTEAHLRVGRSAPEVVALVADLDADLAVSGEVGPDLEGYEVSGTLCNRRPTGRCRYCFTKVSSSAPLT